MTFGPSTYAQIGYGCMGLSGTVRSVDEESKVTLRKAIALGCTLWDTADVYGKGHNETLVGEVLAEVNNREKVFLVTKFGFFINEQGTFTFNSSLDYAHAAIEASIKRLGTTPDAWIIHRIPKDVAIEDVVKNMEAMRKAGKTRYIGIGECSAATLRRAAKVAKIDFIESEYSLFCLELEENGVLDACTELGVKVLAFSPLGKGFLTGAFKKFEDFQVNDARLTKFPKFAKEHFDHNYAIVAEVERLAKSKGCTTGQVALAWLLAQGDNIIPIPGTRSQDRLAENFGAGKVSLSADELAQLRTFLDSNKPKGERYTEALGKFLDA